MVSEELAQLGTPALHVNQRRFSTTTLDFEIEAGEVKGFLRLPEQEVPLGDVTGVYVRLMDERALPEYRALPAQGPARAECHRFHDALLRWLEIAPTRIVNRCGPMGSNASKPYQAQLISRCGFGIPETLITNDPDLVREFRARHGRVVYKSISGVRSIVQELVTDDLARLDHVRFCPTQFQEFVDGTNVRVHVVGDQVFPTRIDSDATDYRYAGRQGGDAELSATTLSDDLTERCVRLTAALGLAFSGIDLKIAPSGEVFCFEVNPSPGFSYYESRTGQPIARAVAGYLAGR
jgi:glutathione synthase/RimK-type ligase-like ATP-grasp enzyme